MPTDLVIADGEVGADLIAEYEATRREAVRHGIAAGGAVVAAAWIPVLLGPRDAFAKEELTGDARVLSAALGLEQTAIAAYGVALDSGVLDAATARTLELFRDQEREHAHALTGELEKLDGAPPAPPRPEAIAGLTGARSQAAVLAFALELETMVVLAYYQAHTKLTDTRLLGTTASIMGNEGQHLAVLRRALGRNPIPNAFETGER